MVRPVLALLAGLLVVPLTARAGGVLVVVLDDVGVDKVGAYRDRYSGGLPPRNLPSTPTIDGLVAHGLRFTAAWGNPVCSPSRAALLTGRHAYETDVGVAGGPELARSETTLAELFAAEGHTTGLFGKWHLGSATTPIVDWTTPGVKAGDPNPAEQGFGYVTIAVDGAADDYTDWTRLEWPVGAGVAAKSVVTAETVYRSEDDVDALVQFVTGPAGDDWLAVLSLFAAHTDSGGDAGGGGYERDDLPADVDCGGCSQEEIYAALVEDADARLGVLLEELWAADPALVEGSLIVVVGDNGTPSWVLEGSFPESFGTDRRTAGKGTVYGSGVDVPLVLADGCSWAAARGSACTPRIVDPGRDVDVPLHLVDLSATLAELGGVTLATTHATSLARCLADPSPDCGDPTLPDRPILTETFARRSGVVTGGARSGELALRIGDHKLVARQEGSGFTRCLRQEVYDLAADPFETTNLYLGGGVVSADQAAYDALVDALDALPDAGGDGWIPAVTCP